MMYTVSLTCSVEASNPDNAIAELSNYTFDELNSGENVEVEPEIDCLRCGMSIYEPDKEAGLYSDEGLYCDSCRPKSTKIQQDN